jgi:N-acetyl-anhydromuramoyl-L-alanine amidase
LASTDRTAALTQPASDGGLIVDEHGLCAGIRLIASPNFDDRPMHAAVTLLVVHGISLPPGEFGTDAVARLFTNRLDHGAHPYFATLRGVRVSAHFYVSRTGELVQFVACGRRAWHAGISNWRGRDRCNDFSVGIELEGTDSEPYADRQYDSLAGLTRALAARYPIADIVGHADIAPGRKTDPGPGFDWPRYRRALEPSR